jgi:DNA-binding FadR family transcriptional regulator
MAAPATDVMATQPLETPETEPRLAELQPDKLSMRVFASIQSAIKVPPGKRVTEPDLAAQLNVSKTPAREARLRDDRVVRRQVGLGHRRGVQVVEHVRHPHQLALVRHATATGEAMREHVRQVKEYTFGDVE